MEHEKFEKYNNDPNNGSGLILGKKIYTTIKNNKFVSYVVIGDRDIGKSTYTLLALYEAFLRLGYRDGYDDLHSSHKRDEIQWDNKPEAGLISGVIGIPYNMFLNFTNNDAGARNIDDVVIVYRSDEVLTLTWEE